MSGKDWKQLELLVAQIQKELAPGAEVTHNAKLKGLVTGEARQVDVLVRQKVGQYEMMIALDCKDYNAPVNVKAVEEFHGLITDIGAHKGALVCPKGFTRTARKRAKHFNIELYSPVDTDPHKWQVKLAMAVLCDFRGAGIAFGIRVTAPVPFQMANDFFSTIEVYDDAGKLLGTPLHIASERWNTGKYPVEPGEHKDVPLVEGSTNVDNGHGMRVPVTLTVGLLVKQRLFFGSLPIERMRGLKDEQTGAIVTNAFTTGRLDPAEVEKTWKQVQSDEDLPVKAVMKVVGLDCWQIGPE